MYLDPTGLSPKPQNPVEVIGYLLQYSDLLLGHLDMLVLFVFARELKLMLVLSAPNVSRIDIIAVVEVVYAVRLLECLGQVFLALILRRHRALGAPLARPLIGANKHKGVLLVLAKRLSQL